MAFCAAIRRHSIFSQKDSHVQIIIVIIFTIWEFFTLALADGFFHWCLSDNKSLQVTWTLLSILADLSKSGVWNVSTRSLISKSLVLLPILGDCTQSTNYN